MSSKTKGIKNIDTPEMEEMRKTVVEQELSARSWKAFYEKMYYSLEAEKLEPLYREYQERAKKRIEEEQAARDEFLKQLQAEINKSNETAAMEAKLEENVN